MNLPLRRGALAVLLLLPGLGSLALTGCRSAPGGNPSHWNIESLAPRMGYHFLGYREDLDGSYREHQYAQKKSIDLTLRRHFLNNNPENPFEAADSSLSRPRPPHSILPNPLHYFHLESVATGLAFAAATGTFVPIPIGSILGTLEEGGFEEFGEGISNTLTGNFDSTTDEPPSVEDFRVRNR